MPDSFGVTFVDLSVGLPVPRLEIAEVLQIVKQRPDDLVGIAVVKFVALSFAKSDRYHLVTGVTCGFGKRPLGDFACTSWPANPYATAFAQHRFHRRDESSGSGCHGPKIVARRIQREWQPIRNDDQAI